MCTFENNPNIKFKKQGKIIAYKVFGSGLVNRDNVPKTFIEDDSFDFGWNNWVQERADEDGSEQQGFQVFAKRTHANQYACIYDLICPITIYTKNIIKATNDYGWETFRVYEVKSFALWRKDWKKEKEQQLKLKEKSVVNFWKNLEESTQYDR